MKKRKYLIISKLIIFLVVFSSYNYSRAQGFQFVDLSYPFPTKTLKLKNNLEIAYLDEGKGKQTLVFVHGLGSYLPAWQKNIQVLKQQFRCIALDLPGYGKSSKGDYAIGMKFFADALLEFIQQLKLKNVVLIGHSMGGQIAMTLAIQSPKTLKKMILVAPAGLEAFSEAEGTMLQNFTQPDMIANTPDERIKANLAINFVKMPADAEFMLNDRIKMKQAPDFQTYCQVVSKCVSAMLKEPVYQRLSSIKTKTLIIFGKKDALIPNKFLHPQLTTEQVAEYGKSQIAGSQLVMIEEAGHFVNFEQAEATNTAIIQFLHK
ncbi:MAG: alpha/beta hydrolase [Microscillaceae bacterium]|jgi:pimeloyl-ACP methyl ester carboxylesterase|nr:alpha/beta hydrolase [Microscillaceae bacterium]